jgi:hypothetical protein
MTSCTLFEASMAQPVWRQAMTVLVVAEDGKRDRRRDGAGGDCVKTVLVSSPRSCTMFGIIRRRPCDAVKVGRKGSGGQGP